MKPLHLILGIGWALLAGAAQAQSVSGALNADLAVEQSIANPGAVLEMGWIWMDVCGSGSDDGRGFLNSYADYRDRRSLNVRLDPTVRIVLAGRLGEDPVQALRGQRIRVRGPLMQARINLYRDGVQTGHYFQTHLVLQAASDLEVLERAEGDPPSRCSVVIS